MTLEEQCAAALVPLRGTGAIIAGGVARDAIFGREAKDIDVFVPWTGLRYEGQFSDLMTKAERELNGFLANGGARSFTPSDPDRPHEVYAQGVIGFLEADRLPINIIALNMDFDLDRLLARFDLDLCRAWFDEDKRMFYAHAAALRDFDMCRMTYRPRNEYDDEQRSYRRYMRLVEKYPGFDFVVANAA